jgi:hypothetical protein
LIFVEARATKSFAIIHSLVGWICNNGTRPRFIDFARPERYIAGLSMFRAMVVALAVLVPVDVSAAAQVWYVRNNVAAGGNGSRTSPFNQLALAETQSRPGDTIFLFAGDATTANQNAGITLKDRQSLIGEGVALIVDDVTIIPAGRKPTITNRAGSGIRLANDNSVRGLTVADTKDQGIVGQASTSSLTIDGVRVERSGAEALLVNDGSGVVSIDSSDFDTAPGDLVKIGSNSNLSLRVTNSRFAHTAPPAGNDGLRVVGGGSGTIHVMVRGNTFESLLDDGIDVTGRGLATDAYVLNVEISDNRFASPFAGGRQLGANAIAVKAQSQESINVTITGNNLNGVSGPGAIELTADDSATLRGRIAANQIIGAGANGIDVQADESTDVALLMEENTIRQSARYGISAIGFPGNARLNLAIRNNHITLSQRDGVMLALYGGSMLATLAGNDVTAPVGMGFLLTNISPGMFMLQGDPLRSAQENLQRSNTGSAGTAGIITVVRGRQHVVHR